MTMMTASPKMICPRCGAQMNHHADKLVHGGDSQMAPAGESVDGYLEEFHSCPRCGAAASRHAAV